MMYKVFFISKSGQGYTMVNAETKEEAIARADLAKGESVTTVEEVAMPTAGNVDVFRIVDMIDGTIYATCDSCKEALAVMYDNKLQHRTWIECIKAVM